MRARALLPLVVLPLAPAPAKATTRAGSLPAPAWRVLDVPDTDTLIVLAAALVVSGILATFLLRLIYLKVRATLAEARLALAEKRAQIAAIPVPPARKTGSLTLTEIDDVLDQMPEVSPELSAAILNLLAARLKEKSW